MSDEVNSPGLRRLRAVLDDSAASIDAATLSRLNRARQAALASRGSRPRYTLPLGLALAASLVLAVVVARRQPDNVPAPVVRVDVPAPAPVAVPVPNVAHEQTPARVHEDAPAASPALKSLPAPKEVPAVAIEAADIADDFADLPGDGPDELAQEDLEFYAWLDAQEAQDG